MDTLGFDLSLSGRFCKQAIADSCLKYLKFDGKSNAKQEVKND